VPRIAGERRLQYKMEFMAKLRERHKRTVPFGRVNKLGAYREGSFMEQSQEQLPGALAPPQLCLEGRSVELAPEEPRTRIRN